MSTYKNGTVSATEAFSKARELESLVKSTELVFDESKYKSKHLEHNTLISIIKDIDAIGSVSLEKRRAIEQVRKSYDTLSADKKSKVTNYAVFLAAEEELKKLIAEYEKEQARKIAIAANEQSTNTSSKTSDSLELSNAGYITFPIICFIISIILLVSFRMTYSAWLGLNITLLVFCLFALLTVLVAKKDSVKKIFPIIAIVMISSSALMFMGGTIAVFASTNRVIEISTAEEFQRMQGGRYRGTYLLTADIDFEEAEIKSIKEFRGILDGNGHTVSNFTISGKGNIGIFKVNKGTIKNIAFSDTSIMNNSNNKSYKTGTIAGKNLGVIDNCVIESVVWARKGTVGGVAGYNEGVISNTRAYSSVSATYKGMYAGGIAACNAGGEIKNCQAHGAVNIACEYGTSGKFNIYAGGVVGYNEGGSISATAAFSSVTALLKDNSTKEREAYAGGFAGCNSGTITECSSVNGVISATIKGKRRGGVSYAGGFAGIGISGITRCYAGNDVYAVNDIRNQKEYCYAVARVFSYEESQALMIAYGNAAESEVVSTKQTYSMAQNQQGLVLGNLQSFVFAADPTIWNVQGQTPYLKITETEIILDHRYNGITQTLNYSPSGTLPIPDREGFTFTGWCVNTDFKESDMMTSKASLKNGTILYARWQANTYIIFDSQGGSPVQSIGALAGSAVRKPINPQRAGFVFAGWYIDSDCTGGQYTFDEMPGAGLTLYAKWLQLDIILFDSMGGGTVDSIEALAAQSVTAPQAPERQGYIFDGWYTASDYSDTQYIFGTMPAGGITLYAKWQKLEHILFESEGGTEISKLEALAGTAVESPEPPQREGYVFDGWYQDRSFNGQPYVFEVIPEDSITLYAKWLEIYSIVFVSEAGSDTEAVKDIAGAAVSTPVNPERERYAFAGWYADADFEGAQYAFDVMPEGGITLYAKWLALYDMVFVTGEGSELATVTAIAGAAVFAPEAPVLIGHTFEGWYDNDDFADAQYAFGVMPEGGITLYAKWRTNTYTITFDSKEGSPVDELSALYLSVIEEPDEPVREHYIFAGWYTTAGILFEFTVMPENGILLIAKWTAITFTVTFDTDGGTAIAPHEVREGSAAVRPSDPSKAANAFEGWYISKEFEEPYDFDALIYAETTVYAKWVADPEFIAITDIAGFLSIANNLTGKYYLANDINLKGEVLIPMEEFNGIFDGNDKKIFNFSITAPQNQIGVFKKNSGVIKNLSLEEFIVNVAYALNDNSGGGNFNFYAGAIVGQNTGTIERCRISGEIKITYSSSTYSEGNLTRNNYVYVGGIAGHNEGMIRETSVNMRQSIDYSLTSNSYVRQSITCTVLNNLFLYAALGIGRHTSSDKLESYDVTGKLTVKGKGYGISNGRWYDSYANANIGAYVHLGGVIGLLSSTQGGLTAAQADVEIKQEYSYSAEGNMAKYNEYGGFTGSVAGRSNGTIDNASSSGSISSSANNTHGNSFIMVRAGGITGQNDGTTEYAASSATIDVAITGVGTRKAYGGGIHGYQLNGLTQASYATGSVKTISSLGESYGGGLLGINDGASSIVRDSHASGGIISDGDAGGFCGNNQNGSVINCYSTGNVVSSGAVKNRSIGGLVGYNGANGTVRNSVAVGNITTSGEATLNVGAIIGANNGTATKIYSYNLQEILRGGNTIAVPESAKAKSELCSYAFLVEHLYWETEKWELLPDEYPLLWGKDE